MKNCKHNNFICYLLILVLVFIFITCGDDEENEYIENSVILNVGDVTVYQGKGVSNSDFNVMVDILNLLLSTEGLTPPQISNFKIIFTEILIKPGTGINHNGNVLIIGCEEVGTNIYKYLVTDNNLV